MKLSPLFIFLILLFVLVISVIFSNWLPLSKQSEGFISQYYNKTPLDTVQIPQYSTQTKVSKLYDNLFFDTANGNLIEINGTTKVTNSGSNTETFNTSGNSENSSSNNSGNSSPNNSENSSSNNSGNSSPNNSENSSPNNSGNSSPNNSGNSSSNNSGNSSSNNFENSPSDNLNAINNIWVVSTDTTRQNSNIVGKYSDKGNIHTAESKNPYKYSYDFWSYTTQTVNDITDTYQVFYINWLNIRFMHIINLTTLKNVNSYIFNDGNLYVFPLTTQIPSILATRTNPIVHNNSVSSNIVEPLYDPTTVLYKLTNLISYDSKNRKIIIKNTDGTISLYSAGEPKSPINISTTATRELYATGGIANVSQLSSAMIYDNDANIVLSTIYHKLTIIVLIKYYDNKYIITNVFKFDWQGNLYVDDNVDADSKNTDSKNTDSKNADSKNTDSKNAGDKSDTSGNYQSDYYKWYWYWKIADNNSQSISNDYILKTQVVPPVCPSCPSCPSSSDGVCTNCGGNGGSGTLNDNINSLGYNVNRDLNNVGSALHNDAKAVISGVHQGVRDVGSTLHNDARTVISGVNQGVRDVGSTLREDAKSVISGVNQDVRGLGSGIYNAGSGLGSSLNQNLNNFGHYNTGVGSGHYNRVNSGIDNYSAYGALTSKGGNFIPITNSFSAFGK